MLKESQWARNFANVHFGEPTGDFGAQQRFMGIMVNMLAQMQGKYAMENLMGEDGLYHGSDGNLDYTGNWVMLHALSDIAGLAAEEGGRYMNPDMHPMFDGAATMLFQALQDRYPESAQEAAAAIRALSYRAWTATDDQVKSGAISRAKAIADSQLQELGSSDVVDGAAAIVGLVTASIIDSDVGYLDTADTLFQAIQDDFDADHGVFTSKSTSTVDDVAWILGGLNSLVLNGNQDTQEPAKAVLLAFYESTMSVAGMQLSAPPGKNGAMASEWEKDLPSILYYHPADTPPPPMSGKLTVPTAEITFDGHSWEITSDRFVTAGAMHLANEMNWFGPHLGSLPFPPLESTDTMAATTDQTPQETNVIASMYHFDPGVLAITKGKPITFTATSTDTFHSFSVKLDADAKDDLFSLDLSGGATKSHTFTPTESGTLYLYCKPHESRGMTGEITVN